MQVSAYSAEKSSVGNPTAVYAKIQMLPAVSPILEDVVNMLKSNSRLSIFDISNPNLTVDAERTLDFLSTFASAPSYIYITDKGVGQSHRIWTSMVK